MPEVATRVCAGCGSTVAAPAGPCPQCGATPAAVLPAGAAALAVGRVVAGKYELMDVLGHGATGSVYRARQIALDAQVAVKVLRGGRPTPERLARLYAEARRA